MAMIERILRQIFGRNEKMIPTILQAVLSHIFIITVAKQVHNGSFGVRISYIVCINFMQELGDIPA